MKLTAGLFAITALVAPAVAQDAPTLTLFNNVHVFNGKNEQRIENAHVLIEGNLIKTVSTGKISAEGATVVDGGGRTMIPGLIDVQWHMTMAEAPQTLILSGDF